jgi:hypothetical protein
MVIVLKWACVHLAGSLRFIIAAGFFWHAMYGFYFVTIFNWKRTSYIVVISQ